MGHIWFYLSFDIPKEHTIPDESVKVVYRLELMPFYIQDDCHRMGKFVCEQLRNGMTYRVEPSAFRDQS